MPISSASLSRAGFLVLSVPPLRAVVGSTGTINLFSGYDDRFPFSYSDPVSFLSRAAISFFGLPDGVFHGTFLFVSKLSGLFSDIKFLITVVLPFSSTGFAPVNDTGS